MFEWMRADACEGGRSDTLDEERADTYGGYGRMFEWVRSDACEGRWVDAFGEGGLIPLGEGVRSFDLGSLYL